MPRITDLLGDGSPVTATVLATLLIIVGVLVIVFPELVPFVAGIVLILAGVALLASLFLSAEGIVRR